MFKNRRTSIRRSARSGNVKGPIDPKGCCLDKLLYYLHLLHRNKLIIVILIFSVRFAAYRAQQLTLKPLFFEVPLQEPDPLFVGRHWLIKEMEEALGSSTPGVLITGQPGTGKTAIILQLVEYSCFGRRRDPTYNQGSVSDSSKRC